MKFKLTPKEKKPLLQEDPTQIPDELKDRNEDENESDGEGEIDDAEELHTEGEDEFFFPVPVVDGQRDLVVYQEPAAKAPAREDPLQFYLREISKYPLLSPEQEQQLVAALKSTGDIEIAKKLVLHNLRLVVKIAMEFRHAYQNVMDLIQEGNIGLMKAVSKYDPEKGAKLSYYASWWIRSYILKFILDNFRLVKIGTTNEQKKLFYNLLREKNRLLQMGIGPDSKTIATNLGVSEKSVILMDQRLGQGSEEYGLDVPMDQQVGGRTLEEMLVVEEQTLDDALGKAQELSLLRDNLQHFLAGLKTRDRDIFQKRLLSEVPASLQMIADEYGVSRERIRQVEERLINKLKIYMSEFLR